MGETPLHLLDLPAEVLTQILKPLLIARAPIRLCPCSRPSLLASSSPSPSSAQPEQALLLPEALPILLSHPRLHAVASPILYGPENEYLLDLTAEHHAHVRKVLAPTKMPPPPPPAVAASGAQEDKGGGAGGQGLGGGGLGGGRGWRLATNDGGGRAMMTGPRTPEEEGLLLTTPGALARISRLTVSVDRLRRWIHDAAVPLMSDMIMHGSLRQLDLALVTSGSGASSAPGMPTTAAPPHRVCYTARGFSAPPLSGLVPLLADPDLWSARMWIEADHDQAWCRFHRLYDGGGGGGGGQRTVLDDVDDDNELEGRAGSDDDEEPPPCPWAGRNWRQRQRSQADNTTTQAPAATASTAGAASSTTPAEQGEDQHGGGLSTGPGQGGVSGPGSGSGIGISSMVVRVDWRRIVKEVDPGGEMVPVSASHRM